jgi:hypothetical protein
MVKEAIMAVRPQAFMLAEKFPDEIKCRPPCFTNLSNTHAAPHCSERLRADAFGDHLIIHHKFRF